MAEKPITVAALGIDHRHIFGMLEGMIDAGCAVKGWWTEGNPIPLEGFVKRFPDLKWFDDRRAILDDPDVDMVLISAIPSDRARLAIEAMEAGKDVMVDKPACVSLDELEQIKATIARTGRIWSVNYGERFEVPSVGKAGELAKSGAIGQVVQTIGIGPHRINPPSRLPWFYERRHFGGILADIASHQIDQFLYFTNSSTAEIVSATAANYANPEHKTFEDFGQLLLRSATAHGFIRVDWYTPDALPTWGDGRLIILGTEGYIELRKYIDIFGRPGTDHLFLTNKTRHDYIDCANEPLTFFKRIVHDIRNRTETAMTKAHAIEVMRLALTAEATALRLGNIAN
jgi:predicted dehydrogenase